MGGDVMSCEGTVIPRFPGTRWEMGDGTCRELSGTRERLSCFTCFTDNGALARIRMPFAGFAGLRLATIASVSALAVLHSDLTF
jgi:hypothetical protein